MGRKYKQLSQNDRISMETLLNKGHSVQEVADYLHVHRSTIYREMKRGEYVHRNSDYTEEVRYSSDKGQQTHDWNAQGKGRNIKIGNDIKLAEYIENKIVENKYSPEAALAAVATSGIEFSTTISVRTLYRYIDNGIFLKLTNKHLPVKGKKKKKNKKVRKIETVYASLTHITNQEVDDGFTTILTFEGGTEVLVEVGTNNYISLPRWYVLGEDGTAVIRDWQLNGEIIRKTGITEEKVVPVKTAAGLTKTMAPRREDTIVKEELPHVSGDIADFHRNVAAVIRDGAEPEIKLFQVMRVMKLMEAIFQSAETNQVIDYRQYES